MKITLGKEEVESMVDMWVYKNFVEKEVSSCKVEDGTISIEVKDYQSSLPERDEPEDIGALERGKRL